MIFRTLITALSALLGVLLLAPWATAQTGTDDPGTDVRAMARQIAASYASISPGSVDIIAVEAVEFADSSLGCPQPDMAYLTVITPGHKVIAQAGSRQLDIRIAGSRGFVCETPGQSVPRRGEPSGAL